MKRSTLRIATLMLALTLITSCFVGGTFAKYVTSANGADNARVAKWGVTASITGGAFATSYDIEDDNSKLELAVESSTEDKLVAPGTEGTFTGVALAGTPETAVNVTKTATVSLTDWIVNVDADGDDKLDGEKFYCPIVVTINETDISGLDYTSADDFKDAIVGAIEAANGEYEPNTNLASITGMNGNYDWEWAFENNSDLEDTALGDKATLDTISIKVEVSVTQID